MMDEVTSHCICCPATTIVVLIVFTITGSTEDCSAKRRIRKINTRKSIEMRFKAESYPTHFIIKHIILLFIEILVIQLGWSQEKIGFPFS